MGRLTKAFLSVAALLFMGSVSHAITYQSVRASTSNVLTPTLQTGTMNLSSGTIQNLTVINGLAISTGSIRVSTLTVTSSGTISNLSVTTGTIGNLSVSTLTVTSSGTISNLNISASFSGGGFKLTNVSTPTLSTDAATKGYVDILANGSTNYIQNTSSLQSGATFFVSSGTVADFTVTRATVTASLSMNSQKIINLAAGAASTDAGRYGQIKVLQCLSYTTTTSSTTTGSTFIATNLSGSITPVSASNKVLVMSSGGLRVTGTVTGSGSIATLFRNGTDVTGGNELVRNELQVSGVTNDSSGGYIYMDSPSSTSSVTYAYAIRSGNASDTAAFPISGTTASLILCEIQP